VRPFASTEEELKPSLIPAGMLALLLASIGCQAIPARLAPSAQPVGIADSSLPGSSGQEVAAIVNGQAIAMATYQAQLQAAIAGYGEQPEVDPESADGQAALAALRRQVLEWLIDQALIDQAARREGIAVDEDLVIAEVERIRREHPDDFAGWLATNGFTEETFRAHVRSELLGAAMCDRLTAEVGPKMEQVHLRHIVVESEAEARALLNQLRQGSATFAALARAHSIDEASRATGGDVGFVLRPMLPESLAAVAFAAEPGQLAGPVKTPLGWHVIEVVARDPARDVAPELLQAVRQEMLMRWLELERARAEIVRYVE
jgi:parvulin-like peptidyl-prolyl isomerase